MKLSRILAGLALPVVAAQAQPTDVADQQMRACAQLVARPPGGSARLERAFREAGFATTREDLHVPLLREAGTRPTVAGKAVKAKRLTYAATVRLRAGVAARTGDDRTAVQSRGLRVCAR